MFRSTRLSLVVLALAMLAVGCADDADTTNNDQNNQQQQAPPPGDYLVVFSQTDDGPGSLTVIDPAEAEVVFETSENLEGVNWGGVISSPDSSRLFINERTSEQVFVFDTATFELEAQLDVGERPVHIYNPNHRPEIWSHADGEGAFYVIDIETLAVSEPVVAALNNSGHGKLLYDHDLDPRAYATNTDDPAIFPIDLETMQVGEPIELCGIEEDGELAGGTHAKAYSRHNGYAYIQCRGGRHAIVDTESDEVLVDNMELSGRLVPSPDTRFLAVVDTAGDKVRVFDTVDGDGLSIDAEFDVAGEPHRLYYHETHDGKLVGFTPTLQNDDVAVIDFETMEVTERIEVGKLTKPEHAHHFTRWGEIGGGYFFTTSDEGIVIVDVATREVTGTVAIPGTLGRMLYVEAEAGNHDHH